MGASGHIRHSTSRGFCVVVTWCYNALLPSNGPHDKANILLVPTLCALSSSPPRPPTQTCCNFQPINCSLHTDDGLPVHTSLCIYTDCSSTTTQHKAQHKAQHVPCLLNQASHTGGSQECHTHTILYTGRACIPSNRLVSSAPLIWSASCQAAASAAAISTLT